MEAMHERVAGLVVHKAKIVACVRIMSAGKVKRECRTFETSTAGLGVAGLVERHRTAERGEKADDLLAHGLSLRETKRRGNPHDGARSGGRLLRYARNDSETRGDSDIRNDDARVT